MEGVFDSNDDNNYNNIEASAHVVSCVKMCWCEGSGGSTAPPPNQNPRNAECGSCSVTGGTVTLGDPAVTADWVKCSLEPPSKTIHMN